MTLKQRSADKAAAKGKAAPAADSEKLQYTRAIEELSAKVPAQVAPYVKQAAPHVATLCVHFVAALPYIVDRVAVVQGKVSGLPEKAVYGGLGFLVCFFGGIFPATIAAVEAWQVCGGVEALQGYHRLYQESLQGRDANGNDDSKDGGNDAKADVAQLEPKELLMRNAQLVLKSADPETVSSGVVGLYTALVGVLAVLRINLARAVTLGERIGDKIYGPVSKYEPVIEDAVPEEYQRWVPILTRWACKLTAISVAWWMRRAVSTFHSAIRGGLLFGHYLVEHLREKGMLKSDADQAHPDEAIKWAVAAAGLLFQLCVGLPFLLGFVLWPVQLVEAIIVWGVPA